MERLTERDEDGAVTLKCDIFSGITKMVLRLAAYEDTGMTPEEITALKEVAAEVGTEQVLTVPERLICEAVGATRLTRGKNDEYVLLWGDDGEIVAKFIAAKFPSVRKGDVVEKEEAAP